MPREKPAAIPVDPTEDLRRELAQYRCAINAHVLLSITNPAGIILEVNDRFCAVSGYSRDELVGRSHAVVNSGEHPHEFMRELRGTVAAGRMWQGVVCNRTKAGALFWVNTTIVPLLGARGHPEKYLALRTDITAQRRGPLYDLATATEVNRLLSLREIEVLALLGEGVTTKQVADQLGVSPKTIESHRQHIETKLNARGQVALAKVALRAGLAGL